MSRSTTNVGVQLRTLVAAQQEGPRPHRSLDLGLRLHREVKHVAAVQGRESTGRRRPRHGETT